jgi:putative DNA primase/helicase
MPVRSRGAPSLLPLARALGGDTYAGGCRALLPAPGHSASDRSVSLWLQAGRVVVHTFGAGDWREVLDELRLRGWIDADNRLLDAGGVAVAPDRAGPVEATRVERMAAAHRLWDGGGSLEAGSAAAMYLARRRVSVALADAGALRAHAAAPAAVYRGRGPYRPALLAAVRSDRGRLTAVEVTYLDLQGRRSALARPPRKVVGVLPAGCAVRLAHIGEAMLVGEGVATTISAMRRFGLPGWALLSTNNLRRWSAPQGVRRVLIAGDRGADGERSAGVLCARLRDAGTAAEVVLPPVGAGDWNDLAQEEDEEGRDGAPGSQGWSLAAGQEPPHGRDRHRS